jgi:hypothetical protein
MELYLLFPHVPSWSIGKLLLFLSLIFPFIKLYCRWRTSHSVGWLDHRLNRCVRMKQSMPCHSALFYCLYVVCVYDIQTSGVYSFQTEFRLWSSGCTLVDGHQCFRETCCLHLQGTVSKLRRPQYKFLLLCITQLMCVNYWVTFQWWVCILYIPVFVGLLLHCWYRSIIITALSELKFWKVF